MIRRPRTLAATLDEQEIHTMKANAEVRLPRRLAAVCVAALLVVLNACSSAERAPDASLRPADAEEEPSALDEETRLRKLQAVRVINAEGIVQELAVEQVAGDMNAACGIDFVTTACNNLTAADRLHAPCSAAVRLCTTHQLLELAMLRSGVVRVSILGYTVPPQSTATNAALAGIANEYATETLRYAIGTLRRATGLPATFPPAPTLAYDSTFLAQLMPLPQSAVQAGAQAQQSVASFLAATVVEAQALHKESAWKYVESNVAAADAQLGATASVAEAQRRMYSAAAVSRFAAARLLVGGGPTFSQPSSVPLCDKAPLSNGGKAALDVLRQAAVSPADIANTSLALPTLLDSHVDCQSGLCVSDGVPPQFSVAERLGLLWKLEELYKSDARPVRELLAIDEADFAEAREYLRQEQKKFSRSSTAQLAPPPFADPRISNVPLFAGTASKPSQLPNAYYTAMVRATGNPQHWSVGTDGVPALQTWARSGAVITELPNYSEVVGFTASHAVDIAAAPATALTTVLRDAIRGPLALLASDLARERPVRVTACAHGTPGAPAPSALVVVNGYRVSDRLRLVVGEDALRCAISGTVEGAPCTLPSEAASLLTFPATVAKGFNHATGIVYPTTSVGSMFYIVAPKRPGAQFEGPGEFSVIVGLPIRALSAATSHCDQLSLVLEAEERAAKIMMADRERCASTQTSCDGLSSDDPVPLEDELSDDNNGVENSWQHYLTLARDAATEADRLGEAVIEAGLEQDTRSEAAIAELQQLCGVTVDPASLGVTSFDSWNATTPCSGTQTCADPTTTCVSGKCVKDITKILTEAAKSNPDASRLLECVGNSANVTNMTPGSEPMCAYRVKGKPNSACFVGAGVDPDDFQCPRAGACPPASDVSKHPPNTAQLQYEYVDLKPLERRAG